MLSRALNGRNTKKRALKHGEGCSLSQSIHEDECCIVGLMGDLPLCFCDRSNGSSCGGTKPRKLTLREVLQSSVQVMGESGLGISEKVVLLDGTVYAAKRFRKVIVGRGEFGRRIERLAQVSRRSEYLVPIRAYLYAKRLKLVLCDYHPMGSLADLLTGGRELGHTSLDWDQRLNIILHVAKAIAFIHSQSPPQEKHLQMNVHGNISASNVLIKIDFSACLLDYGFAQLAEPTEVLGPWRQKLPQLETANLAEKLSQKGDIYNFGGIMLDILGGSKASSLLSCTLETKEKIKDGGIEFLEPSFVEGTDRMQALQVLNIALACTNRSPEARPSIDDILLYLEDVLK